MIIVPLGLIAVGDITNGKYFFKLWKTNRIITTHYSAWFCHEWMCWFRNKVAWFYIVFCNYSTWWKIEKRSVYSYICAKHEKSWSAKNLYVVQFNHGLDSFDLFVLENLTTLNDTLFRNLKSQNAISIILRMLIPVNNPSVPPRRESKYYSKTEAIF